MRMRLLLPAGLAILCSGAALLYASPALALVSAQSTPVVAPCPDPGEPYVPSSAADLEELIVGTWIRCGEGALLPTGLGGDDVGIEFAADGTFHRLYDDGALVRAEGLEQQGRWTTLFETPGLYQLNVSTFGSGTVYTNPAFFGAPPSLMQTPHMGDETAAFVRWDGDPPVGSAPDTPNEGPCDPPTGAIEPESIAEAEELLAGAWVRCGPNSAIGPVRPGEIGIEIASDGRFFRLYDDRRGGLIRASGGTEEGTWELIEGPTGEWPPAGYQLDLTVVGTHIGHAVFLEQPRHFRFVASGAEPSDYQAWTGAPPIPGSPPVPTLPFTGPTESTKAAGMLVLALVSSGAALVVIGRGLRYRLL